MFFGSRVFLGLLVFTVFISRAEAIQNLNPYMSPVGTNNMHVDSYASDVHPEPGPRGPDATIAKFKFSSLLGVCPLTLNEAHGKIVTVCTKLTSTLLYTLDPSTLKVLGSMKLPARKDIYPALSRLKIQKLYKDTSGGTYFYLDHLNRAVIPTSDREVWIISISSSGGLSLEEKIDLRSYIQSEACPTIKDANFGDTRCDKLTAVLPDWAGRVWFTSRYGVIGVYHPESKIVQTIRLRDEEIQNSFSIAEEGAYIVSDHALYHLKAGSLNEPEIVWRQPYDRGSSTKVGQINQGSGTTPTVMKSGYVSIGDNADSRMNVLVYERGREGRLVCHVPVFRATQSACENSFIGVERSVFVANTSGYKNIIERNRPEGGMARIDIRPDGSGCDLVWETDENAMTATPKYSLETGLIYIYGADKKILEMNRNWALKAIDPDDGREVFRIRTGKGRLFDNNWGAISLGRDGAAWVGNSQGMFRITGR